jgi:hypothetical protein
MNPEHCALSSALSALAAISVPRLLLRTAQSVNDTHKLNENPITGRFDDLTSMLTDFGVDQFTPLRLQPRERALAMTSQSAADPLSRPFDPSLRGSA